MVCQQDGHHPESQDAKKRRETEALKDGAYRIDVGKDRQLTLSGLAAVASTSKASARSR